MKKYKKLLLSTLGLTVIGVATATPISVAQNVENRISVIKQRAAKDLDLNITDNEITDGKKYTFNLKEKDTWKWVQPAVYNHPTWEIKQQTWELPSDKLPTFTIRDTHEGMYWDPSYEPMIPNPNYDQEYAQWFTDNPIEEWYSNNNPLIPWEELEEFEQQQQIPLWEADNPTPTEIQNPEDQEWIKNPNHNFLTPSQTYGNFKKIGEQTDPTDSRKNIYFYEYDGSMTWTENSNSTVPSNPPIWSQPNPGGTFVVEDYDSTGFTPYIVQGATKYGWDKWGTWAPQVKEYETDNVKTLKVEWRVLTEGWENTGTTNVNLEDIPHSQVATTIPSEYNPNNWSLNPIGVHLTTQQLQNYINPQSLKGERADEVTVSVDNLVRGYQYRFEARVIADGTILGGQNIPPTTLPIVPWIDSTYADEFTVQLNESPTHEKNASSIGSKQIEFSIDIKDDFNLVKTPITWNAYKDVEGDLGIEYLNQQSVSKNVKESVSSPTLIVGDVVKIDFNYSYISSFSFGSNPIEVNDQITVSVKDDGEIEDGITNWGVTNIQQDKATFNSDISYGDHIIDSDILEMGWVYRTKGKVINTIVADSFNNGYNSETVALPADLSGQTDVEILPFLKRQSGYDMGERGWPDARKFDFSTNINQPVTVVIDSITNTTNTEASINWTVIGDIQNIQSIEYTLNGEEWKTLNWDQTENQNTKDFMNLTQNTEQKIQIRVGYADYFHYTNEAKFMTDEDSSFLLEEVGSSENSIWGRVSIDHYQHIDDKNIYWNLKDTSTGMIVREGQEFIKTDSPHLINVHNLSSNTEYELKINVKIEDVIKSDSLKIRTKQSIDSIGKIEDVTWVQEGGQLNFDVKYTGDIRFIDVKINEQPWIERVSFTDNGTIKFSVNNTEEISLINVVANNDRSKAFVWNIELEDKLVSSPITRPVLPKERKGIKWWTITLTAIIGSTTLIFLAVWVYMNKKKKAKKVNIEFTKGSK